MTLPRRTLEHLSVAVVFSLLGVVSALAGENVLNVRRVTPADGLAYQVVRDVVQSRDGAIWFATWGGGLSRYDGVGWRTLTAAEGLVDDGVRALAVDGSGGLWAGASSGISHFDGRKWESFTRKNTPRLAQDSVFCIKPLRNGRTLFGMTDGYLYSYDPTAAPDVRWGLFASPEVFRGKPIRDILEDVDGSLWIGTNQGLYRQSGSRWDCLVADDRIYSLVGLRDGRVLAAGIVTVYAVRGTRVEQFARVPNRESIQGIAVSSDGTLLAGTSVGLWRLKKGNWSEVRLADGASHPFVEVVRIFEDGSVWVGSRTGAFLIRHSDWTTFPHPRDEYCGFSTAPDLRPLLVRGSGSVETFDKGDWTAAGRVPPVRGEFRIFSRRDGRFLVQDERSILEFSERPLALLQTIPLPQLPGPFLASRTTDGTLWVYSGDVLERWDGNMWRLQRSSSSLHGRKIHLFKESADRSLWLAYDNGIERRRAGTSTWEPVAVPRFPQRRIIDICTARDGSVWIATSGSGIFVVDGNRSRTYSTKDGLSSDWIHCLLEASDGSIWAGLDDSSAASFRDGRWIQFSSRELALDGEVADIQEDNEHAIWFVIRRGGLVRYKPSREPPRTQITVSNARIVPEGIGIFSLRGQDAWHSTQPAELVYSWRLLNAENGATVTPWTEFLPETTVSTRPLSPGRYVFEARSADKERNVDPESARAEFSVEPYVFTRPAFWIPVASFMLLAAVSLAGLFRRQRELKKSRAALLIAKEQAEENAAQATRAAQAKGEFVANISHEIRTPMNAVIGMSNLVLQTELSSRQRDYIEKIQLASQSLLSVINDVLDFSKIEAGKLGIENVPFVLSDVLSQVSCLVELRTEEKGLELLFDIDREVPNHLVGDPLRLGQILTNLASNAVKFTERGEIVVSARVAEAATTPEGHLTLEFSVKDTGIGIDPGQIEMLFQSFTQADGSTTRRYGGTGLGLSIARRLVELLGGGISAESEPGRGSRFTFTVRMQAGVGPASLPTRDQFAGQLALVVDDNPVSREILAGLLASFGFDVTRAESGSEALAILGAAATARSFRLVLLDWRMPAMDGIETAARIRSNETTQVPEIMMVSAFGRDEVIRRAREVGIKAFLTKPVHASLLLETIQELLGGTAHPSQPSEPLAAAAAAAESLRGARVLLVEDNRLNQEIAGALLRKVGVEVEIVDDGREAVEAFRRTPGAWDAILMDVQMPGMDGFEATRQIRLEARPDVADSGESRIPVIAMTAHALPEERQLCIDAGMDDHIPKPFDPRQLWDTLSRWIPPKKRASTSESAVPSAGTSAVDGTEKWPAGLDAKLAIERLAGNRTFYARLLKSFREDYQDVARALRDDSASEDYESLGRTAHTLEGLGGTIGSDLLAGRSAALERACRSGTSEVVAAAVAGLIPALENALDSIRRWELLPGAISGAGDALASTPRGPVDSLLQELRELDGLLGAGDYAAKGRMQTVRRFLVTHGREAGYRKLEELIDNYDFDEARGQVRALIAEFEADGNR